MNNNWVLVYSTWFIMNNNYVRYWFSLDISMLLNPVQTNLNVKPQSFLKLRLNSTNPRLINFEVVFKIQKHAFNLTGVKLHT